MPNFKATVGTGVNHAFETYVFEAESMARAVSIADTAGRRNFDNDVRVISISEIGEKVIQTQPNRRVQPTTRATKSKQVKRG
jgi:hypothetical protein